MTQALPPGFYPSTQSIAAAPVPPDETLYYVVGGASVLIVGLVALLAVSNERDHEVIRGEVGDVEDRLLDLQQRNAYEHAMMAEQQARMGAALQGQIHGLQVAAAPAPVSTLYAEPLLSQLVAEAYAPSLASQVPPSMARVPSVAQLSAARTQALPSLASRRVTQPFASPTYAEPVPSFMPSAPLAYPPSMAPPPTSYASMPPASYVAPPASSPVSVYVQTSAPSMGAPSSMGVPSGATPSTAPTMKLPSHLESAIASSFRKSSKSAAPSSSAAPTLAFGR